MSGDAASAQAPVSVITPCYRCASVLPRAIDSVLAQTMLPAELILVDDASDDAGATRAAIEAAQRRVQDRIVVKTRFLKHNGGPGTARNAAWEEAAQPLIAFLDADDAWHPRKLVIQTQFMQQQPDAALSGHKTFIARDAASFTVLQETWRNGRVDGTAMLIRNRLPTRSVMLRSAVPLRFAEGKRASEDYLLWLRLVLTGRQAWFLDLPLACSFKEHFGAAGLTRSLWRMELGELDTYRRLRREGLVSAWTLPVLYGWSFTKFASRIATVALRAK